MRISTLCNICYIVVSRELLLYVFLQKLLHYLNKFTNRHRAVCQRQLSFLLTQVSAWYRRWTRSMHSISCLPWGAWPHYWIVQYSYNGKTYTVKARRRSSVSRETKLHWRVGVPLWLFAWYGLLVLKIYFQDTFAVKAYLLIAYEGLTGQITAC